MIDFLVTGALAVVGLVCAVLFGRRSEAKTHEDKLRRSAQKREESRDKIDNDIGVSADPARGRLHAKWHRK